MHRSIAAVLLLSATALALPAFAGGAAPRQVFDLAAQVVSVDPDGTVKAQDCSSGQVATGRSWPITPEVGSVYQVAVDISGGLSNVVVNTATLLPGGCPGGAAPGPGQTPGPANTAPVCPERTEVTMGVEQVEIHGNCWDADGDELFYFADSYFDSFFMEVVGGIAERAQQVRLKPHDGFTGDDEMRYGATDQKAGSNIATLVVHVVPGQEFTMVAYGGTDKPDQLLGNPGEDTIDGAGGADMLEGAAGDDEVDGGEGSDTLNGGAGDDELTDDGAGSDTLDGGAGNDVITDSGAATTVRAAGKPKGNTLKGGAGADRIRSVNGVKDKVDCGAGRDRATVDRRDTVKGCEKVSRRG